MQLQKQFLFGNPMQYEAETLKALVRIMSNSAIRSDNFYIGYRHDKQLPTISLGISKRSLKDHHHLCPRTPCSVVQCFYQAILELWPEITSKIFLQIVTFTLHWDYDYNYYYNSLFKRRGVYKTFLRLKKWRSLGVHVYLKRKYFLAQYWNCLNFFTIPVSTLSQHLAKILNSNFLRMHINGEWKSSTYIWNDDKSW